MSKYTRWILINIFLPLSPFALRLFIIFIGNAGSLTIRSIAEIPEILFYSIFICVIALNINLETSGKKFEQIIRLFLFIIIVLDFITLGMVYSSNVGPRIFLFCLVTSIIPPVIAVTYKFIYNEK